MMPLNHILTKSTNRYKLHKLQEKNQPSNVHRWHETVYQKGKRIRNPNTVSDDIGMEFGIEKWAMLIMKSRKQHIMEGIKL